MRIIGVTGKSGAGKSTFTDFLGERKNVGIIHLDNIFGNLKEEKFQKQIKGRNKDNSPRILSDRVRSAIHNSPILFKLSNLAKKILIKKRIEEAIRNFKIEGKDAVIIEGIHLRYMIDPKILDKMILVRRPYYERIEAVQERDGISKAEIVERDLPFKKKMSSLDLKDFDYVIENIYGKEELRAASERIYDEVVGIKTFDERYVVKTTQTPKLRNIVTALEKTSKNLKKQRTRED